MCLKTCLTEDWSFFGQYLLIHNAELSFNVSVLHVERLAQRGVEGGHARQNSTSTRASRIQLDTGTGLVPTAAMPSWATVHYCLNDIPYLHCHLFTQIMPLIHWKDGGTHSTEQTMSNSAMLLLLFPMLRKQANILWGKPHPTTGCCINMPHIPEFHLENLQRQQVTWCQFASYAPWKTISSSKRRHGHCNIAVQGAPATNILQTQILMYSTFSHNHATHSKMPFRSFGRSTS